MCAVGGSGSEEVADADAVEPAVAVVAPHGADPVLAYESRELRVGDQVPPHLRWQSGVLKGGPEPFELAHGADVLLGRPRELGNQRGRAVVAATRAEAGRSRRQRSSPMRLPSAVQSACLSSRSALAPIGAVVQVNSDRVVAC